MFGCIQVFSCYSCKTMRYTRLYSSAMFLKFKSGNIYYSVLHSILQCINIRKFVILATLFIKIVY